LLAVAPNSPVGSAAPHSEITRASADVPDRPRPMTNRMTGRAFVPFGAAGFTSTE
jgi:hypothetical protein